MELSYKELTAIQEKIVGYRSELRELISEVDEKGHRKLNPIFFLSGEIAAYKIVNIWYKRMLSNEFKETKQVIDTLGNIGCLMKARKGDFRVKADEEDYEYWSQLVWYDLFDYQYNDSVVDINKEIIEFSWLMQAANDIPEDEMKYCLADAEDDAEMGIVYTDTHNMFMNLEPQQLKLMVIEMMKLTKLYKLHFDIFQ